MLIVTPGKIKGMADSILKVDFKYLFIFVLATIYAPGRPITVANIDEIKAW
ncbi:hypothetical protein THA_67 [Thermosipho africanus TCF52B]|uniref:Uncharacterized protein n=1 Tax=Thermosipho africanus (strain TCF52B) TaxID=484019 RepID=B7IER1_THEAB|nr:hypothetical protein THA_67 [Thermosipho africanus TCF52B]